MNTMKRQPKVALRQVAEHAGVSLGTASSVFTNKPSVTEQVRLAVRASAAELGYQPRTRSRTIQARQAIYSSTDRTFGLLISGMGQSFMTNPFYDQVLCSIEKACKAHDIGLMYEGIDVDSDGRPLQTGQLPLMIQRGQVQGLLVIGYFYSSFFALLQATGIPFVTNDEALAVDSVTGNDEYGAYLATRHLLEQGHVHPIPAMISGSSKHPILYQRWKGYCRALAEYNQPYQEAYVQLGDTTVSGGYRALRMLLEQQQPSAIFCCNDSTVLGVLQALQERGIAVPEECSIIGYDDIEDLFTLTNPPLTTIHVDRELMGAQGVWHLLERLE